LALAGQFAFGPSQAATVISISLAGLTLAGLPAILGSRVLRYAPGASDMASAGTSTAFNTGITAGAFFGGVLLPGPGVRSTALVAALVSLAAFAIVLAEPALSSRRRVAPATARRARARARRSCNPAPLLPPTTP
jgi:predicted MFS family arabinose efflux permease